MTENPVMVPNFPESILTWEDEILSYEGNILTYGFVYGWCSPMSDAKCKTLGLLSSTTVSFAADAHTVLYTVPVGKRCVLHSACIVAATDAGATTAVSIGANGAETDFVGAHVLSNLDAQYDSVWLMPIPNATPVKCKSYAAGTVIEMAVATQSGGAGNTVYLFGYLY